VQEEYIKSLPKEEKGQAKKELKNYNDLSE